MVLAENITFHYSPRLNALSPIFVRKISVPYQQQLCVGRIYVIGVAMPQNRYGP